MPPSDRPTYEDILTMLQSGSPKLPAIKATITKNKFFSIRGPVGSRDTPARVVEHEGRLVIEVQNRDQVWLPVSTPVTEYGKTTHKSEVSTEPKASAAGSNPSSTSTHRSESRGILFLDATGWSKLEPSDIVNYVNKGMPFLKERLAAANYTNTWGDAIVATFASGVDAAKAALGIMDEFHERGPLEGFAGELHCRIALHVGEVILCKNPFLDREDIFGDAIHMAARLEPVTAPGYVFCTAEMASALETVKGMGPKAWPIQKLVLAKKYGEIEGYVVTKNKAHDPRPGLKQYLTPPSAEAEPDQVDDITEDDALLRIESWLKTHIGQLGGKAVRYHDVDRKCTMQLGTTHRLLPKVIERLGSEWALRPGGTTDFIVTFTMDLRTLLVSSEPRRGF